MREAGKLPMEWTVPTSKSVHPSKWLVLIGSIALMTQNRQGPFESHAGRAQRPAPF